ncbi:MAG: hypothetical protein LBS55_06770 [Prevotellaceae bacterium]|nr:hypothetical protein [Prevotellaceae bacterium]
MKQKHMKVLLVASLFIVAAGWQIYNRRKAVRQTLETTASYIPVSARIESVYPTGRGRRGAIITVIYTHEGTEYIKTFTRGRRLYQRSVSEGRCPLPILYLNPR